jgi:hypothetical protein
VIPFRYDRTLPWSGRKTLEHRIAANTFSFSFSSSSLSSLPAATITGSRPSTNTWYHGRYSPRQER